MAVAEGRKVSKSTVSKRTDVCTACKLTVSTTEYTVCQAFCPVVQIGSLPPLTRKRVLLPPLGPGGGTLVSGGGGGGTLCTCQKTLLQNITIKEEKNVKIILSAVLNLNWCVQSEAASTTVIYVGRNWVTLIVQLAFVHCKKKVSDFPVPSRDVTNQTLSGRK